MKFLRTTGPLALGVCLVAGVAPAGAADLPRWAEESSTESLPIGYMLEDAVVLLSNWTIEVDDGERKGTHRMVVRVLSEDGVQYAETVVARNTYEDFKRLRVWVRESSGRVRRYGEDEGLMFTAAEHKILDDTEIVVVNPPGVGPGSLIAIEYDWSSSAELPQDSFPIQRAIPVRLAEVSLELGADWRARARMVSSGDLTVEEITQTREWRFEDVPAAISRGEGASPQPPRQNLVIDYAPSKADFRFGSWNSTAVWALRLFSDSAADTARVREFVGPLTVGRADPIEAVGDYVRGLRYYGIELGHGGFVPRPPAVTLDRGFGDCKDKSFLMVALLRSIGVEAAPVLTSAPSDVYVDPKVSGPLQFNHCVVGIKWDGRERKPGMAIVENTELGTLRIFDPTLSASSGADTGFNLEGASGLIVDQRAENLIRFPESGATDNVAETRVIWTLDRDPPVEVKVVRTFTGYLRNVLQDESGDLVSVKELRRKEYGSLMSWLPGFTDLVISDPHLAADGEWSYSLSFLHAEPMAVFQEFSVLWLSSLQSIEIVPLPHADATEEIHQPILAMFRHIDEIHIGGQDPVQLPAPVMLANEVGRVSLEVSKNDDWLSITRELELLSPIVSPDSREDALNLRRALRKVNRPVIVFTSEDAGAPKASRPHGKQTGSGSITSRHSPPDATP